MKNEKGSSLLSLFLPSQRLPLTRNLEPRVSPALCQRLVAGRNSGIMEFLWIFFKLFDWLFAEQQPIRKFKKYSKKFYYPRVSPGDQRLTKSLKTLGSRLAHSSFSLSPASALLLLCNMRIFLMNSVVESTCKRTEQYCLKRFCLYEYARINAKTIKHSIFIFFILFCSIVLCKYL